MKPKVLIADDDKDFVKVITTLFHQEGFEVFSANEGVRAIEAAHKNKPDIILLDLKMPAGNGFSVIEALRSRTETELIPVIVISGSDLLVKESDLIDKGAQAYLRKPFQKNVLLKEVHKFISQKI